MLTRRQLFQQQLEIHTRCQVVESIQKHKTICGKPADWETVNYGQLGVCNDHKKLGVHDGLTLDQGTHFLGLSPSSVHYRRREKTT